MTDQKKNKLKKVKVTVKPYIKVFEGQKLFLNYAYYAGTLPAYMDNNFVIHNVKSKLHLARYYATTCFVILLDGYLLTLFILDVMYGEFNVGRVDDVGRLFNSSIIIATMGYHILTMWKSKEFIALVNNFNLYITKYSGLEEHETRNKMYRTAGLLLRIVFLGETGIQAGGVFVYIIRCKWHFLASILPICEEEFDLNGMMIGWAHGSVEMFIPYAALNCIFLTQMCTAVFIIIVMQMPIVLVGLNMVKALSITETESYFSSHAHWILHYRSFAILIIQMNDCIRDFLLPYTTAVLSTVCILLNFILIRFELSSFVFAYVVLMDSVSLTFLILLYNRGVNMLSLAEDVLIMRKTLPQTDFTQRDLDGLKPITASIGSMHNLDGETRLIAFQAVQDYTLNLLMTV